MGKSFLKACGILLVILVVLYYISYSRWASNDFDDVDITYKDDYVDEKDANTDKKSQTVSGEKYKYLYDYVNYELIQNNFGEEFLNNYYYGNKFSDEYYLYVAVINLLGNEMSVNCNIEKDIDSSSIRSKISELFGSVIYNDLSFSTSNGYLNIVYDENNNSYKVTTNKCNGFEYSNGGIKTEYVKSIIKDDYLYIYEKAFYLNYSFENGMTFNYHSGMDENSEIVGHNYETLDLNKMPTYIYRFKKNGNSYTFVDVVKDN